MTPVNQLCERALQFHRAGQLRQAESLYRQILQIDPCHPDALLLLGMIAHKVGRNDQAIEFMRQAIRYRPNYIEAFNNLGNVLKDQGKLDEAIASYRKALELKPDFFEVHNNLANAMKEQGKLEEAVTEYQQALHLKPDSFETYNNLGTAFQDLGKLEEAIANFQQALNLKPDYAQAYNNLGIALKDRGHLDEAIVSFKHAIRLRPDHAKAFNNLGIVLKDRGDTEEAIVNFREALRLKPDFVEVYNNLGMLWKDLGKYEEAIASYQRALRLKPDYAETYSNVGVVLQIQGKLDESIAYYRQALSLKPDFATAYNNLAIVLKEQGKIEEALDNYRLALRLKPNYATAHSNLVFCFQFHPGYDSAAIYREARQWNTQHAEPLSRLIQPHENSADPDRRLRIGYVSPDFRNHPVSFSMVPLLSAHNRSEVEVYCYSELARPDHITERLKSMADGWRTTIGLSDERLAELVRRDRIDILVDLALHSANNRLLLFARKPAPIQVSWCGYPGTTGLSAIDYRLTDPYLESIGENDASSSEEAVRLPDSFWCYDPLTDRPLVNELPALSSGIITFGCLNNFCKFNDCVLTFWASVLRAIPRSRLFMLAPSGQVREHVRGKLKQQGIDETRVEFTDRKPRQEYLQLYHRIDIGLDLLPYNGHTTSLDAFWMGVPTITLIGNTVVGRAGWSQLCNLKLTDLSARTPEDFIAIATQLAEDLPRLQELRVSLRERLLASPLMDSRRFAANLEKLYRQIWRKWCQTQDNTGHPAPSF